MRLSILYDWKIDPDNRQNRADGPRNKRPMTPEEWAIYGPVNTTLKRVGFGIKAADITKVLAGKRMKQAR